MKKGLKIMVTKILESGLPKMANNASKTLNIYINIFNVLIVIDEWMDGS